MANERPGVQDFLDYSILHELRVVSEKAEGGAVLLLIQYGCLKVYSLLLKSI